MDILLRRKGSDRFYAGPYAWTADRAQATRFTTVKSATLAARHRHLPDAEILLTFEAFGKDIVIPVQDPAVGPPAQSGDNPATN